MPWVSTWHLAGTNTERRDRYCSLSAGFVYKLTDHVLHKVTSRKRSSVNYPRVLWPSRAMDAMEIIAAQEGKYKSTEVKKEVELELDLGNLLATDLNPIDTEAFKYYAMFA